MRISDWSSDVCSSDLGFQCIERWRHAHITLPEGFQRQDNARRIQCLLHPIHAPAVKPNLGHRQLSNYCANVARYKCLINHFARCCPTKAITTTTVLPCSTALLRGWEARRVGNGGVRLSKSRWSP